MNRAFWRGKRVLITGHTGFKGAWLCLLLHSLGARVAGFALDPPTQPNLYDLARVDEWVDSTVADVRDLAKLSGCVSEFEPEVVFHMAAQSVVLQSYHDPIETYSTNVLGTVNLLEAVRHARRPCTVINVTTDKCYENKGQFEGYTEDDELGGHDPYSSSKACAELVGAAYRESFFPMSQSDEHRVGLASARAGNVIGGGDWTPRQLVPDAISAFVRSQAVTLRHPSAIRPWQHVLDCLAGYLTLAQAVGENIQLYSGAWNFGPCDEDSRSVSYVVETLGAYWGSNTTWVLDGSQHLPEEQLLRLDVTKAAKLLNWRCRLTIDEALHWVASWYRGSYSGRQPRELCQEQISAYLSMN
ncbi:MAG: CDP-glucose 4,6-dehydratase [Burkholderiaceae bacterium]